jgi:hypothetical protein
MKKTDNIEYLRLLIKFTKRACDEDLVNSPLNDQLDRLRSELKTLVGDEDGQQKNQKLR